MVKIDFINYFYIFRKSLNYTFLFFKFKNKTNKYFEKQSLITCAKLNLKHNRFSKYSNRRNKEILNKIEKNDDQTSMKKFPKLFFSIFYF